MRRVDKRFGGSVGPSSSAGSWGGHRMGQGRDDAVERLGQSRAELTGGGGFWGPGGVGGEVSVPVTGRTVVLEMDMGGRQVWAWPGWTAEEAGVSGDGWV